jgi:hypothetical protein
MIQWPKGGPLGTSGSYPWFFFSAVFAVLKHLEVVRCRSEVVGLFACTVLMGIGFVRLITIGDDMMEGLRERSTGTS